VEDLTRRSEEFRGLWERQEVGLRPREVKHFLHPEVGPLELNCQSLHDPSTSQALLVSTAQPGTESHEKLQLLSMLGASAAV